MSQFDVQPDPAPPEERKKVKSILGSVVLVRQLFPYGGFEGLSNAEIQILLALFADGDASPPDLADKLNFDRTSVSEPLVSLGQEGMVAVESGAAGLDRRHRVVHLTRRGDEMVRHYLRVHKGDI